MSPPLGLGQEWVPEAESALVDALLALQAEVQEQLDYRKRPVPRGQHPKPHGCVRAELIVEPNLPPEYRHGVFAEPWTFPAVVRFSNARQSNDQLPDVHGLSIKILEVDGPRLLTGNPHARTQDLVMIDHPVFFARNVADLVPVMIAFRRVMLGGPITRTATVLRAGVSFDYRFRILRAMVRKRPDNPLRIRYWTTTPLKFGPTAAKLSMQPDLTFNQPVTSPAPEPRHRLRHALAEHLRTREARFDLMVQLQTDPRSMPIEDAATAWPEDQSPFRKVATLRLPAQSYLSEEQQRFGENLSFSPWHGLQAHRPLGGINRARRRIYETLARRRRELNGSQPHEPTAAEVDAIWARASEPQS